MKTIRKFSLVLLSMVLLFTLTSCDETGAVSVDTAKVEKSVLSVIMMNMKYWPVIRLINLLSATWPEKLNSHFLKYHYL